MTKDNSYTACQLPILSYDLVDYIRDELEHSDDEGELNLLNAWKILSENDLTIPEELRCRHFWNPFGDLTNYVRMGQYPPPELLIAITEAFQAYMNSSGELTLEEVFFGPQKKRIGNFSQRTKKKSNLSKACTLLRYKLTQDENFDRSQIDVAEEVIKQEKLNIEPESLIRALRRSMPQKISEFVALCHEINNP